MATHIAIIALAFTFAFLAGWAARDLVQKYNDLTQRIAELEKAKKASETSKLSYQKTESIEELTAQHLGLVQELELITLHVDQLNRRAKLSYNMSKALRDNKHARA